jgi:hypothetical protein
LTHTFFIETAEKRGERERKYEIHEKLQKVSLDINLFCSRKFLF